MRSISLAEAKAQLSALVEQAAGGEPVLILRRGKPIAQITGIERPRRPIDLGTLRALTDRMQTKGKGASNLVRAMRDGERY
jgi:prevent-host-death family protein